MWPCGLSDHTLCFVEGLFIEQKISPCLIIVGGENYEGKTLSDCWILDLQSVLWSLVSNRNTSGFYSTDYVL